jgi:hypothetical protein
MKRCNFLYVLKIVISTGLFILTGCTLSDPTIPHSNESLSADNTVAVSRLSSTPPPLIATPTPFATPLLAPTPDITLTRAIQPTATETPIAIPTPPDGEITQQALWLFETNNGCQLPCWWGIVPGETEGSIAEEFLSRFDPVIYRTSSTPGLEYYEATIPLPTDVFAEERTQLRFLTQNGIVQYIDTDVSMGNTPPGYLTPYRLSTFLTTYGQPAEVWVSTYRAPYGPNDLPFRVVLFYPDQGIAALYSDNASKQGDVVRGCPQQGPVKFLSLWHAPLGLTFEEVKSRAAVYNVDFLSLEESTTMDVATFYETFKDPENITCLETPASFWP